MLLRKWFVSGQIPIRTPTWRCVGSRRIDLEGQNQCFFCFCFFNIFTFPTSRIPTPILETTCLVLVPYRVNLGPSWVHVGATDNQKKRFGAIWTPLGGLLSSLGPICGRLGATTTAAINRTAIGGLILMLLTSNAYQFWALRNRFC